MQYKGFIEEVKTLVMRLNTGFQIKKWSPVVAYDWLVGWFFRLNGPLRQFFTLYRAVSQRERKGKEK